MGRRGIAIGVVTVLATACAAYGRDPVEPEEPNANDAGAAESGSALTPLDAGVDEDVVDGGSDAADAATPLATASFDFEVGKDGDGCGWAATTGKVEQVLVASPHAGKLACRICTKDFDTTTVSVDSPGFAVHGGHTYAFEGWAKPSQFGSPAATMALLVVTPATEVAGASDFGFSSDGVWRKLNSTRAVTNDASMAIRLTWDLATNACVLIDDLSVVEQ